MSHSRTPDTVEAAARSSHRFGAAFGSRFFVLIAASLILAGPALFAPRLFYVMFAWDGIVLAGWVVDLIALPRPGELTVRRRWLTPVTLSIVSSVRVTLVNRSARLIRARIVDALPYQLRRAATEVVITVSPHAHGDAEYTVQPSERGATGIAAAYIRYQGRWRLAERWARADLDQTIVVYPDLGEGAREALFLVRSRQTDVERRSRPVRAAGRTFESLREHRPEDELRDICWTATARRGKLVTRTYELERSQPLWLVLDSGRLMRTRLGALTKLDHAVNAALTLAQVALASGDRVGLLAYGRRVEHYLPAARGGAHLRLVVEHLAHVQAESAEPNHFGAAARLLRDQKRRSLIVWITDAPDVAMLPDVVAAAAQLRPRHLVLFVVVGDPDLDRLIRLRPQGLDEMYRVAAAQEVAHRRELLLARVRASGALTIESTAGLSPALVNAYLAMKQRL